MSNTDTSLLDPTPSGAQQYGFAPPKPASDQATAQPPPQMSDADIQKMVQQRQAITDKSIGDIDALDKRRMALASQPTPHPAHPQLGDIPKPPDTKPLNVFKEAQAPLIFATVFGAAMMKNHGMGAMAAATGFLEGWQKGDQERMDRERQKWNDSVDAIIKENGVQKERYDMALNDTRLSQADKAAQISAISASLNDTVVKNSIAVGNLDFAHNVIEKRNEAALKLYEAQHKAANPAAYALSQFIEERKAAGLPPPSASEIQSFIQSGRAGRSAITMYMNKYTQEHPYATAEEIKTAVQDYSSQLTAINRFKSGPQGNTIKSLNTVVSHLDTMRDLGGALKNGDLVAFNRAAQRWAEETGNPAPTNFDTAKQIVGAEIIKAIGVAGAGTQTERQEASDAFNRARSPEQLAGAIETARKLLIGQLKSLRQQFKAATGRPESEFDEMLNPETRTFFDDEHASNLSDDDLKKKLGIP